jgi:hypothetical protein
VNPGIEGSSPGVSRGGAPQAAAGAGEDEAAVDEDEDEDGESVAAVLPEPDDSEVDDSEVEVDDFAGSDLGEDSEDSDEAPLGRESVR